MIENKRVVVVNPLGAALLHYSEALRGVLGEAGVAVKVVSVPEPSSSGSGPIRWILRYLRTLLRVRTRHASDLVIVTWPVLGYWDFLLTRLVLGKMPAWLTMHDPIPLVRAAGYGQWARRVAGFGFVRAEAIVHSDEAMVTIERLASLKAIASLPLPMLPPTRDRRSSTEVVVRVLGQYKPDRDVDALSELAADGKSGWRYEIVGRGWTAVRGWKTVNRYLSEAELSELIRSSTVVLIPYRRFFQSAMAVRSLEVGTPVVGPKQSSLSQLIGGESPWLVSNGDWGAAINAAVAAKEEEIHTVARGAYTRARERWVEWLRAKTATPDQTFR